VAKAKAKLNATERVQVPVSPDEHQSLKQRAAKEEMTVAGLFRKGVGLPGRERGGARDGAGRPPAKKSARKRKEDAR